MTFRGWIGRIGLAGLLLAPAAAGAEIRRVGAGSYLHGLPDGWKGPPAEIYRTTETNAAVPSNDWWSSLAWTAFSEAMYPHPLALKAEARGFRVYYPGPHIAANDAAIFGSMPGGDADLRLGHSAVASFPDARVAGWSDWFVTAQMGAPERGMRLSFGHGSPFVYAQFAGGGPVVTFARPPEIFAVSARESALGVRVGPSCYGLFAPSGSTWAGLGTARLAAETGGKAYFSLAVLPDDRPETFALFRKYAHSHVTDTRVAWRYDEREGTVQTGFAFATAAREGGETGTLFALYPHQWRTSDTRLTGHAYASVRGPMKLAAGRGFTTTMALPPVLPALPLPETLDRAKLRGLLAEDLADKPRLVGDTYWLGKQLGKWATLIPIAEQAGDEAAAREAAARVRGALENFLAAGTNGAAKGPQDGVFAYDPRWGALIGYPPSYGSEDQLNDHHFHYGYFIRAAAELARRDPAWAAEDRGGGMVRMLIRDIASPDRADPLFPFLRCCDPYAGHSWASGHAKFGDGNNNESSSEAVHAWYGIMLFGEATGDRALRDLGVWMLTTEIAAIEDYWFDVRDELHPADYPPSVVTMIWGGKGANGTWFSANPELVHGINFLPFTGASLYLGRWPAYARRNYDALVRENLAFDEREALRTGRPAPAHDGTAWDAWADIIWMYRALSDPADARRQWEARPADFPPEAGNSRANTWAWIAALEALGTVGRAPGADAPFAAVFERGGRRTHVAANPGAAPRTVTFRDGAKLDVPPRGLAVR